MERFPLASDWPAADTSEGSRLRASAAEWDMLDTRAGFDAARCHFCGVKTADKATGVN